jgi:hypothetical protein
VLISLVPGRLGQYFESYFLQFPCVGFKSTDMEKPYRRGFANIYSG